MFTLASKVICDDIGLKKLEEMVRKDFAGVGPYLTDLHFPSTKESTFVTLYNPLPPSCGISPSPSNDQRYTPLPKVLHVASPPSYASPPDTPSPASSAPHLIKRMVRKDFIDVGYPTYILL